MSDTGVWWRIEAPHFVAGLVVKGGRVAGAAPIIAWSRGKSLDWMVDYCHKKGWQMEPLTLDK